MYVPYEIVEILAYQLDDVAIEALIMVNTNFLTHISKMHNTSNYWKTKLMNSVNINPRVPTNAMIHKFHTIDIEGDDELQFWKDRYQHYITTLDGNIFMSRDPSDIQFGVMIYSNAGEPEDLSVSGWDYCSTIDNAMFDVIEYGFYESLLSLMDHVEYSSEYTNHMIDHRQHKMLNHVIIKGLVDIRFIYRIVQIHTSVVVY